MKKIFLSLIMVLAAATSEAQTVTNVPRTNFEVFNSTPDVVLVKGMTVIGVLNNQIKYPVEIRAERLTNQQNSNSVYAVSLHTRVGQPSQLDYIDYDELGGLIQ